jgi:Fe2+ or Zn2+ uptake regulation protein
MNYSKQRDLILQAVSASKAHPTAEAIYNQLKAEYPRLSLATVYRNLNQLCGKGALRRLYLPDSPDRFDGTVEPHYHLYCTGCSSVIDLQDNVADWRTLLKGGMPHRITGCNVLFYGTCADCLAQDGG